MKVIELEQLKEIGIEMNNQDCRATQNPMFVILVDRYVPADINIGWDKKERKDDDYMKEEYLCDDCRVLYVSGLPLPEECDACSDESFNFSKKLNDEESFDLRAGVFFTAKACQEHIDANHYHYDNPRVYGIGSWRNFEMQKVQRFLSSLGGKVASHYE